MFSKFPIVTMSYPSTKHRIFGQHANQYSITLDAGHLLGFFFLSNPAVYQVHPSYVTIAFTNVLMDYFIIL